MDTCRCKEDLDRIRERAAKEMSAQSAQTYDVRVMVHMGTCGLAAGAQEVMDVLKDEAARQDKVAVQVISCGCAGMCSSEPNVTVERRGEQPVMYQNMDADKMRQVFKRHVLGGEVQTQFALARLQDLPLEA
ncbi:MAG: (2Fe-2S) ferredoxin domain-containing protein [Desulfovermiculus sp.]